MTDLVNVRFQRKPLPECGGYVCDTNGVIDTNTIATMREVSYLHEEAVSAVASLIRSHEALRTRAEAAERECLEQARLNGMGGEREARLLARLTELEHERDLDERVIADARRYRFLKENRLGLRAVDGNAALFEQPKVRQTLDAYVDAVLHDPDYKDITSTLPDPTHEHGPR